MQRSTQTNGLINLLALLAVCIAAFIVARLSNALAGLVTSVFMAAGVLSAAVSWFQMRLEERERLEKLEFEELRKSRSKSAMFEAQDVEGFPAQRSREQFERFFVPIFTGLLFLAEAGAAYWLWSGLTNANTLTTVQRPALALSLFALFALLLFLLGKFSATIARLENHRLLRPGASWLLLSAYLSFVVALGVVGVEAGFPKADLYVAKVLVGLLALVALETLVSLILEIYRPRVKGAVARPLYESRFVGLLAQPEGLLTTAAHTLDYQFGFKVSETWFYREMVKHSQWVLLQLIVLLFLSTSIVFIDPGEQGLLERFGRPVAGRTVLDSGAHWKMPWPIDRVYRHRTEQIQSFNVGSPADPDREAETTVLWTDASHQGDENFIVASHEEVSQTATNSSGRRTPPVNLLTVSIPVHFQVRDLQAWTYNNDNASNLLQAVATREVVRYLVSADLNEIMSRKRAEAADVLRERIQVAADERQLGTKILFVGLQDIHPPTQVAGDYERVIGAYQTNLALTLAARAYDIETNAQASAQAVDVVNRAKGYRASVEIGALAQAALFTNQIPTFQAAPEVYRERAYLRALVRATDGSRKYLLLTTNANNVFQFDLQDKFDPDFLDLSVDKH